MSNAEQLQKIIAAYTPLDYRQVDLSRTIEDKYIASELKDNFCNDICLCWRSINRQQLYRDMFTKLKTGEDILRVVQYIRSDLLLTL
jgi:hypothetical protein